MRIRANVDNGRGVCQVRPSNRVEDAGGHRQGSVDRIRTAVSPHSVAVGPCTHGPDHRPPLTRRGRTPGDRESAGRSSARMRGQPDVTGAVGRHDDVAAKLHPKKRKGPARREPNERPYCLIVGRNARSCNCGLRDFIACRRACPADARPAKITINVALAQCRPKPSWATRPRRRTAAAAPSLGPQTELRGPS